MTEFQALENEPDFDGFMRVGSDGHGIACGFNRGNEPKSLPIPAGCIFADVETGEENRKVPAHDCLMFAVHRK